MKKKILPFLGLLIAGCSTSSITPTTQVIPVPFNEENSYALNIANQTFLRQPYKWGLETYQSPLRDFTSEEVEQFETDLASHRASNSASASYAAALMSLATGNLMGTVISAAGGPLAHLADTDHIAARGSWIIALDANDYADGIEANNAANKMIEEAVLETLRDKGNVLTRVITREAGKSTFGGKIYEDSMYVLGEDQLTGFGLDSLGYDELTGMQYGKTNLIDAEQQYVTVWNTPNRPIGSLYLFYKGHVNGYDEGIEGYEQYLKDVTAKLPEGFFLYLPSLPQIGYRKVADVEDWSCATCGDTYFYRMYNVLIPAIYTQGEKHLFLKPN